MVLHFKHCDLCSTTSDEMLLRMDYWAVRAPRKSRRAVLCRAAGRAGKLLMMQA